jgi:hypothetical protein
MRCDAGCCPKGAPIEAGPFDRGPGGRLAEVAAEGGSAGNRPAARRPGRGSTLNNLARHIAQT